LLPHAWIGGDDEMGRPAWFRRELRGRGERYLLAVPSNTTIRDLEADRPACRGRGQPPKLPFQQVHKWCESLPASAWTRVQVRDGAKGPIEVEIVQRRVVAKIERKIGPEEMLVVIRSLDEEKKVKTDYHLSNAPPDTQLAEFARVANAEHRIEECIKRAKSEAGNPWHIEKHIEEHQKIYFTSGKKRLALLYLDIDAHHPWQTDEYPAKAILEKVFPFGYFRVSDRGQNGYLKIRYTSIREFNELADRLQKTLKRLFLHLSILCDVEIKGTITTTDKSGSLAKLPFNNKCSCYKRDETDSWNNPQLETFKVCPVVKAGHVEYIIRRLELLIDDEKVRVSGEYKKSMADKERESQREKSKNGSQVAKAPLPTASPRPPAFNP
jgi:hypothetical protein